MPRRCCAPFARSTRCCRLISRLIALQGQSQEEIENLLLEQVETDYEAREAAIAPENMRYAERRMMLGAIDRQWIDYLTGMEDLRQEIGMQAIAQKDPLTEYQRNAYGMFDELKTNIQRDIVYQIIPVSFQYEAYMRQVMAEQQQRLAGGAARRRDRGAGQGGQDGSQDRRQDWAQRSVPVRQRQEVQILPRGPRRRAVRAAARPRPCWRAAAGIDLGPARDRPGRRAEAGRCRAAWT